MVRQRVPEIDVIIAIVPWLYSKGHVIQKISPPKGKGIDHAADIKKLKKRLCDLKIPSEDIIFESGGPDIVASFNGGIWKIECKGLSPGTDQTLRNNFDRALASAVSYYDSETGIRIGLVMPKNDTYLGLIGKKISPALRKVLGLWVFLYNAGTDALEAIDPVSQLPEYIRTRRGEDISKLEEVDI